MITSRMTFLKRNEKIQASFLLILLFTYTFLVILLVQNYTGFKNEESVKSLNAHQDIEVVRTSNQYEKTNLVNLVDNIQIERIPDPEIRGIVKGTSEIVTINNEDIDCEDLMGIIIDAPLGSGEKCNSEDCAIRYAETARLAISAPHNADELYPASLTDEERKKDNIVDDPVIITTPCKVRIDCKICETKCIWDLSMWQHILQIEQSFTYPGYENTKDEDTYWAEVEAEIKRRTTELGGGEGGGRCGSVLGIEEPQFFCGTEGNTSSGSGEKIKIAEIWAPDILFAGSDTGFDNTQLINNPKGNHARRNASHSIDPTYQYLARMSPSQTRVDLVHSGKSIGTEPLGMHYNVQGATGETDFDTRPGAHSNYPHCFNDGSFNAKSSNQMQEELTASFTSPHKVKELTGDRDSSAQICREDIRTITLNEKESFRLCSEGFWDSLGCKIIEIFK
jgi:hypothetical protein